MTRSIPPSRSHPQRIIMVLAVALALLCGEAPSLAQEEPSRPDPRRAQVAAATADAVRSLSEQIASVPLGSGMTVKDLLDKTHGSDELLRTVQRAEQIGGPRWVDEQTCQVRLELSGDRAARAILSIAAANPKASPVPPEALARQLNGLRVRTFVATGSAIGAERVEQVRPAEMGDAWSGVDERARRGAVSAAKRNAVERVIESVRPIDLGTGQSVGDALWAEPVGRAVEDWLSRRPVTTVQFRPDLQVELTLSAPPEQLLDVFVGAARQAPQVRLPDENGLKRLREEFVARAAAPVGRAAADGQPNAARTSLAPPPAPPEWVWRPIDADASAEFAGSPLRTARAAESLATDNLRAKVMVLPLSKSQTIADLSRRNPEVDEAVSRAMLRARVYHVKYNGSDGSVQVKVSLDSRALWEELLPVMP